MSTIQSVQCSARSYQTGPGQVMWHLKLNTATLTLYLLSNQWPIWCNWWEMKVLGLLTNTFIEWHYIEVMSFIELKQFHYPGLQTRFLSILNLPQKRVALFKAMIGSIKLLVAHTLLLKADMRLMHIFHFIFHFSASNCPRERRSGRHESIKGLQSSKTFWIPEYLECVGWQLTIMDQRPLIHDDNSG